PWRWLRARGSGHGRLRLPRLLMVRRGSRRSRCGSCGGLDLCDARLDLLATVGAGELPPATEHAHVVTRRDVSLGRLGGGCWGVGEGLHGERLALATGDSQEHSQRLVDV